MIFGGFVGFGVFGAFHCVGFGVLTFGGFVGFGVFHSVGRGVFGDLVGLGVFHTVGFRVFGAFHSVGLGVLFAHSNRFKCRFNGTYSKLHTLMVAVF